MSKIMMHKIFWSLPLLATLTSALQPKPNPSGPIQNFAEGNIWLDDSFNQVENLYHFDTPCTQDISNFHDINQEKGQKHMLYDAIEPWKSLSDYENQALSHLEGGPQDRILYDVFDAYWNTYGQLEMILQPDQQTSHRPETHMEKETTVDQSQELHYRSAKSSIDFDTLRHPTQDNFHPHKRMKDTCTTTHDNHNTPTPGIGGFTSIGTSENVPSISTKSSTPGDLIHDNTKMVKKSQFFQDSKGIPTNEDMYLYTLLNEFSGNLDPYQNLYDSDSNRLHGNEGSFERQSQGSSSRQSDPIAHLIQDPSETYNQHQIVQESHRVHHNLPSLDMDLYEHIHAAPSNLHSHEGNKSTWPIKTYHNQNNFPVTRAEVSVSMNTAHQPPYSVSSSFQESISKASDKVLCSMQNHSNVVNHGVSPESVIKTHNKCPENPEWYGYDQGNLMEIPPNIVDHALTPEFIMGSHNMDSGNSNWDPSNDLPGVDMSMLQHGTTKVKMRSDHRIPAIDSTNIELQWNTPQQASSVQDKGTRTVSYETGNSPPSTSYNSQGLVGLEKTDQIETNKNLGHSGCVDRFPLVPKSKKYSSLNVPCCKLIPKLQQIGGFLVNNSPGLCYETTIWFDKLEKDMIENNNQEASTMTLIDRAIKSAHLRITMCFLGLIGIFANEGGDKSSLEIVLKQGWDLIKGHFEDWRKLNIIDKNGNVIVHHDSVKCPYKAKLTRQSNLHHPLFWFHDLSKLTQPQRLPVDLIYYLKSTWNMEIPNSMIGVHNIAVYHLEIQNFHDVYINHSHGGFYGRGEIRNIAFKGVKLSGKYIVPENENFSTWYTVCKKLAEIAQFHSSVGFDLCQEVHSFFVSLIEHLLNTYKGLHQCDISSAGKTRGEKIKDSSICNPHDKNVQRIVQSISMAEYRVTVGFIGLVRVLYQKEVQADTLSLLLKSAWDFLKGIFSKWRDIKSYNNTLVFDDKRITRNKWKLDYSDPHELFNALWQHEDYLRNPIPLYCLKSLVNVWNKDLKSLQKLNPNSFNFVIKVLSAKTPLDYKQLIR
ncbi:uncharacterized protein MELLADRAFT_112911 [Melampsora larici-populina 98AG31]|uniref:Secreted protein n=1 Tax=Melampsora larici-populina (strain 98AG31 / pathotype 3-4-7) TaxID=747676 RepID=F4S832_MELLP|nr:uncharacterized protein MELLADRAFT_112911 [Melampsora larici-populina 98AG31]EGF99213.1 hypothetical protein MELLADRAFT_112911 [Melampsora larici-populina 98AG31]